MPHGWHLEQLAEAVAQACGNLQRQSFAQFADLKACLDGVCLMAYIYVCLPAVNSIQARGLPRPPLPGWQLAVESLRICGARPSAKQTSCCGTALHKCRRCQHCHIDLANAGRHS